MTKVLPTWLSHLSPTRPVAMRLIMILGLAGLLACDGQANTVRVTVEDARFVPDVIHVRTGTPTTFSMFNAGREVHEFVSPLLAYASDLGPDGHPQGTASSSLVTLEPGRSYRFTVTAPAGTYLYWCRRKGHPNMSGTVVID